MMYEFYSNKALHSASLPFTIFCPTTPFDTCDCYYFKSNLSLLMYINMLLIKKAFSIVLNSSKPEETTFRFFFILLMFHWGDTVWNMFPKVERCEKKKEIKGMAIGKMLYVEELYVEELFINFLLILNQNIYKLHWQKTKTNFC